MAVVTRYFSTASAGAGDGTTWADRAALFTTGNWSSVIKNFNFAGSDSLLCLIGPGTYSGITDGLTGADFANPPTVTNNLVLHGCDGSGVILSPPNPAWSADMAPWSDSSLPVLSTTSNISIVGSLLGCSLRLLKFLSTSGTTTNVLVGGASTNLDWVWVENQTANTGAIGAIGNVITNSVVKMSGSSYSTAINSANISMNVRVEGNSSASSGTRHGLSSNGATPYLFRCVSVNNPGDGFSSSATSTSFTIRIVQCIFANNGGSGVLLPSTASQLAMSHVVNCMFTGNVYGINAQSAAHVYAYGNRLRDNSSGDFNGFGTHLTTEVNYTTDSSDADEYVDAGSGDFRIKASATIAPMGLGISVVKPTVAA